MNDDFNMSLINCICRAARLRLEQWLRRRSFLIESGTRRLGKNIICRSKYQLLSTRSKTMDIIHERISHDVLKTHYDSIVQDIQGDVIAALYEKQVLS